MPSEGFFFQPREYKYTLVVGLIKKVRFPVFLFFCLTLQSVPSLLLLSFSSDGNNDAMVDTLRQKAEEWKSNIQSGHLNCHEIWLALNSIIMKNMLYPLPALTLTEEQCTKIMAPVISAGLNCLGVSSKMPRKIVYGNKDEFGLRLNHYFIPLSRN